MKRIIDLSDLTWDELGELTRPNITDKVRGPVMREMGSRPEALTPTPYTPTPVGCSNAGHDVVFRAGVQDRCNTCDVDF